MVLIPNEEHRKLDRSLESDRHGPFRIDSWFPVFLRDRPSFLWHLADLRAITAFFPNSEIPIEHAGLTGRIIAAAIEVHRTLGPGFLEAIYERALVYELRRRAIYVVAQYEVRVTYNGVEVGEHILDLLVEKTIVVELKAIKNLEDGASRGMVMGQFSQRRHKSFQENGRLGHSELSKREIIRDRNKQCLTCNWNK